MKSSPNPYSGHRHPTEIISSALGLYHRFTLKGLRYVPRVIVTDKLRGYGAAHRELIPSVEHCQHKGLNMQAKISHQPTRQQERQMRGFKSAGQAQRFCPRRHRLKAAEYRVARDEAFQIWQ
jgi:putative transposase